MNDTDSTPQSLAAAAAAPRQEEPGAGDPATIRPASGDVQAPRQEEETSTPTG